MRRWPTVEQLAEASEDEVLREWQGLGYYSRARNLHFAAKQIVALGGFPTTIEGIKGLKGVGDYTAAAIGSIAFDLPAAVVDGNVYRVLSRHPCWLRTYYSPPLIRRGWGRVFITRPSWTLVLSSARQPVLIA